MIYSPPLECHQPCRVHLVFKTKSKIALFSTVLSKVFHAPKENWNHIQRLPIAKYTTSVRTEPALYWKITLFREIHKEKKSDQTKNIKRVKFQQGKSFKNKPGMSTRTSWESSWRIFLTYRHTIILSQKFYITVKWPQLSFISGSKTSTSTIKITSKAPKSRNSF